MWHVKLLRKCNFQLGMNSPKQKGNIRARVLWDLITSPDVVCVFDYQGQSYTKYIPKLLEINIFQTNRGEIKTIDFKSLPCKSFHLNPTRKKREERERRKKKILNMMCPFFVNEKTKTGSTNAKIFRFFCFNEEKKSC